MWLLEVWDSKQLSLELEEERVWVLLEVNSMESKR